MTVRKTIYLVDGSAYIYRAYHAIRNLSNSKGTPTNAAFGFTKMLLKLMADKRPEFAGIFFDAKGPTFRHALYPDYKANRPPMPDDLAVQIPFIKRIVNGFNLKMIEMAGFEADDLIGAVSRIAQEQGFRVVMVTGDKDFMQLVTDNAVIWDPMKDRLTDANAIQQAFGVLPSQMVDIMGLSGDSSDNIPGVPGIGPKTANALIRQFGSIPSLYEQIHQVAQPKQRDKLMEFKEQALLSRDLATINTMAPLDFEAESYRVTSMDNAALTAIYQELEFRQLQHEVAMHPDLSRNQYRMITDSASLGELVQQLETAGCFALDTETTSLDPMQAKLVGISIAYRPDEAFYIPLGHTAASGGAQLSINDVLQSLQPVLANPDIRKIGQNIKYDWIVLHQHGIDLEGVAFDTMLASYLIDPSKRAHSLDQIALDFLGHKMIAYEEVAGKGKTALCFADVPLDKASVYACEDADMTLKAFHVLGPMLERFHLKPLFETVEMPLMRVLMKMELRGIRVDKEKLRELSKSFAGRLELIEEDIYRVAGENFNIKSSQQLGTILFDKLGLPVQKKTKKKTGYSTDVEVLTFLAEKHALPALILKHRTLAKLKSTYTDALLELVNPETDRIHTSFNQTVTATGRLSSSEPNLQNIPVRDEEGREIRRAFIPHEKWKLLSADYSQIELRILAHYSEDPILIESFQNDEDIHTRTASEVFEMLPAFITPEIRRQAKAINFGIIYGMSPFGLSRALGISQKMAKTYIDHYFSRYKGVKQFIDRTIAATRESGRTTTLLDRIRLLPDINSTNQNLRQFAERIAVNTPIQGTAADLIKLAMIQIDAEFEKQGFQAAMLLSVHDELVFEVPAEELDAVRKSITNVMEGVWLLRVPLKVNIACGDNWAESH
ncbi:MAG: DNA polymerase I [Thermodesulfobacteriota bacterium]